MMNERTNEHCQGFPVVPGQEDQEVVAKKWASLLPAFFALASVHTLCVQCVLSQCAFTVSAAAALCSVDDRFAGRELGK